LSRTIKWPPTPVNGRIPMVEDPEASTVLVMQVLGDLSQNPFNPDDISMGDQTFRSETLTRARIDLALRRLRPIITINSITTENNHDGTTVYTINFTVMESRTQRSVTYNG